MGSVDWTTLTTAVVSVLGTLGGGLIAQRAAIRDKRVDADRQDRRAEAERAAGAAATALDAKRALYVELNATASAYRQACLTSLLDDRTLPGQEREVSTKPLSEARSAYRAAYARAQMTLPEFVLSVVSEVTAAIALGARLIVALERSGEQDPEALAGAREWCAAGVGNAVWLLRAVLRWDLGVTADGADDSDGPRRASVEDFQALRDDLRRLRSEASSALIPQSRVAPELFEGPGHGTIFGPWPPVPWHRGADQEPSEGHASGASATSTSAADENPTG